MVRIRTCSIRSACRLIGICALVVLLWGRGFADDVGRGGYAGAFLRIGLGARAQGMGGGSVALADDAYTAFYNPAGLVFLEGHRVTTTLQSMALDRRLTYAGYAQSFGNEDGNLMRAGFSVGWLCAGIDNIDARDSNGEPAGLLSNWEHGFFFSFAMNPVAPLALGFSAKLMVNRFPDIVEEGGNLSAVGFGFDVGVIVRPADWLSFGLTVRDLRSRYTWDTQALWERGTQIVDRFPRIIRGGGVVRLWSRRITLALDLEKVEHMPLSMYTGTQVELARTVFLRGGLRHGGLTLGVGTRIFWNEKLIQVDYGFVPDPVAPRGNHVFSWSFIF